MDLVSVSNTSPDKPLVLRHDGQGDLTIAPGSSRVVPIEYAAISFGHPASRNDGQDKARDREYSAARTLWGFYPGIDADADWPSIAPKFEVHTLEGDRLWMVLDDPDGTKGNPDLGGNADLGDSAAVRNEIQAMQDQIKHLTAIIEAQAAGASEVPVPDAPEAKPAADLPDPADSHDDQTERNEQRDELPKPSKRVVTKDKPSTPRAGAR